VNVKQPHAGTEEKDGEGIRHSLPNAAPWQSVAPVHVHACAFESQVGPPPPFAQSAFVKQATQRPLGASHEDPSGWPAQSEFAAQRRTHCRTAVFLAGQTKPLGHPDAGVQPQTLLTIPGTPDSTRISHDAPPSALAQSKSTLQPQACVLVLQSGPSALCAQSTSLLQTTGAAASAPSPLPAVATHVPD
jgi:hypothetical protein